MKIAALILTISSLLVGALAAEKGSDSLRGSSGDAETTKEVLHRDLGRKFDPTKIKVLIRYKSERGKSDAKRRASKVSFESKRFKIVAMEVDAKDILALENNPEILSVDLDEEVHILPPILDKDLPESVGKPKRPKTSDTNDHRRLAETMPYGINRVQADQVAAGPDADKIKVCVVDTGYGLGHPDLPISNVTGFNPYGSGSWDVDGHSHGTHCAGTILAIGNNNQGVVGVIPNVPDIGMQLHVGKGLTDSGSGSISNVIAAVEDCIDNGSNVISMSLGGGGYSFASDTVYREAFEIHGVLVVAAAGNDGNGDLGYPASYSGVMSVAATDSNNVRASFSQYNEQVEIAGPGVSVESTITTNNGNGFGYTSYSGTSMATPHVAGVAALVWSYNHTCTSRQLREILLACAKAHQGECNQEYGRGVVQAKCSVDMIKTGCDAAAGYGIFASSNGLNTGNVCANFVPPCQYGENVLTISLLSEVTQTSWEVTNGDNVVVAQSSGNVDSVRTVPLCVGGDYSFTISDSGSINGSGTYMLELDTDILKQYGSTVPVGSSEVTMINNVECPAAKETLSVDLLTDKYPGETSWELRTTSDGALLYQGGPYSDAQTQHSTKMCVDYSTSYTFTIIDSYGDGICCSYGIGNYAVMLGETTVIESNGEFTDFETSPLVVPEGENSEEPSMAPSVSAAPSSTPSNIPSTVPSGVPSFNPTAPTIAPSGNPSTSFAPSQAPSIAPTKSLVPSSSPSSFPSESSAPSGMPSISPSSSPSSSFQGAALWIECRDKECKFDVRNDENVLFLVTEMSIKWPLNSSGFRPKLIEIKKGGAKLWRGQSIEQPTLVDSWLRESEREVKAGGTREYKLKFEKNADLIEDESQYEVSVTLQNTQTGATVTIPVVQQ